MKHHLFNLRQLSRAVGAYKCLARNLGLRSFLASTQAGFARAFGPLRMRHVRDFKKYCIHQPSPQQSGEYSIS
jgi:hypothetical protein